MKWDLLIFLTLFISTTRTVAQTNRINGTVNTTENIPIPNVHISFKNKTQGTYSNNDGGFTLDLQNKRASDTILFTAIGFQNFNCTIADLKKSATIFLKKEIYDFNPITVSAGKKEDVILEDFDKIHPDSIFEFCPNGSLPCNLTFVKYFPNEKNQDGILKEVAFYFEKKGKPKSPFQIRILSVDSITQMPQIHLLNSKTTFKGKKDQWVKFDLSKYNIAFPKEGLFIGMEWIYPQKRKYRYKTKKKFHLYKDAIKSKRKQKVKLWGQTLKAAFDFDNSFYSFPHCGNMKWTKQNRYNLFIKPTVTF